MTTSRRYWLVKSEPSVFSIRDLARSPKRRTSWEGVRNYQARNYMRQMALGDRVLFYHSNADPPCVAGIGAVVRTAYPDDTQFDKASHHYDPGSSTANPRWDMVDIGYRREFPVALSLDRLRGEPDLQRMELLRRGSRLSVQPVTPSEWNCILRLAGIRAGK
ncbi:MAG: EVE domain-containing protein [Nitrospira sp.]|nr:EVE domain-containing protein [Nitrospira sp.]